MKSVCRPFGIVHLNEYNPLGKITRVHWGANLEIGCKTKIWVHFLVHGSKRSTPAQCGKDASKNSDHGIINRTFCNNDCIKFFLGSLAGFGKIVFMPELPCLLIIFHPA